jgi:hypothetical protein
MSATFAAATSTALPAGIQPAANAQIAIRSVTLIRHLAIAAITLSAVVQIPLSENITNFFVVVLLWGGSFGTFCYVLRPRLIYLAPVSVLPLLGFNLAALAGPLMIQSAYLTPVTYNLQLPLETFSTLLLAQATLVAAHMAYLRAAPVQAVRFATQRLLQRVGAFDQVSFGQLLALGVVGLAATWISSVSFEGNIEFGDVTGRLLLQLRFLAIAPALGILGVMYTGRVQDIHRHRIPIVAVYFAALLLVAFAGNSRAYFAVVCATVVLEFLLAAVLGYVVLNRKRLLLFAAITVCALPVFNLFSDVATAMVMVRGERTSTFGLDLIARTIAVASDHEAVQQYRDTQRRIQQYETYSENYISNPFLARLVLPRYHDNILVAAEHIRDADRDRLVSSMGEKVVALLPTFVLQEFGIDIEKEDLSYSSADLFYNLYSGGTLGGFRLGSAMAEAYVLFGIYFVPLLFAFAVVIFISMDAFSIRLDRSRIVFSIIVLSTLWMVFTGVFSLDSVAAVIGYLLRTLPQNVLICIVLIKGTGIILRRIKMDRF